VRIAFPQNGKYKVQSSIAAPTGDWFTARERAHTMMFWRFDVSGAPQPGGRSRN
jgi:hypothetical protein